MVTFNPRKKGLKRPATAAAAATTEEEDLRDRQDFLDDEMSSNSDDEQVADEVGMPLNKKKKKSTVEIPDDEELDFSMQLDPGPKSAEKKNRIISIGNNIKVFESDPATSFGKSITIARTWKNQDGSTGTYPFRVQHKSTVALAAALLRLAAKNGDIINLLRADPKTMTRIKLLVKDLNNAVK